MASYFKTDYDKSMIARQGFLNEQYDQQRRDQQKKEKVINEQSEQDAFYSNYYMSVNRSVDRGYYNFKNEVKSTLLTEAISLLALASLSEPYKSSDYGKNLTRQLASTFVENTGADKLISEFKNKSYFLSELAYICGTQSKAILEKVQPGNKDSYKISSDQKNDFYKAIDKADASKITNSIKSRVMSGIEKFTYSNIKAKQAIKDIISGTKSKVDNIKDNDQKNTAVGGLDSNALKEAYLTSSQAHIKNMQASKTQNVFEAMVYNMSRAAIKNQALHETFLENSSLNMDKIMEHCEIMYNFLTTITTSKMVNCNEQYVQDILDDMKNM